MSELKVNIERIGQSGLRISYCGHIIYVDPYLSNSVARLHDSSLTRLTPIPFAPQDVMDADVVLLTHIHTDHCDPDTIPALAKASPNARFVGPEDVLALLLEWGIDSDRLIPASGSFQSLSAETEVHAVPAAHPELKLDSLGNPVCIGYVLRFGDEKVYISGDTSLTEGIIEEMSSVGPFALAVLPVNERNYFREAAGIIGNMSVREAFQFANIIKTRYVMPVHWDMFENNAVEPEEIEIVYASMRLDFQLIMTTSIEL